MTNIEKAIKDGLTTEETKEKFMIANCPQTYGYTDWHENGDMSKCLECWNHRYLKE